MTCDALCAGRKIAPPTIPHGENALSGDACERDVKISGLMTPRGSAI